MDSGPFRQHAENNVAGLNSRLLARLDSRDEKKLGVEAENRDFYGHDASSTALVAFRSGPTELASHDEDDESISDGASSKEGSWDIEVSIPSNDAQEEVCVKAW